MTNKDTEGPYIVWVNYGYNGWSPTSYATIQEAIVHGSREAYGYEIVVTKTVSVKVEEVPE